MVNLAMQRCRFYMLLGSWAERDAQSALSWQVVLGVRLLDGSGKRREWGMGARVSED